MPFKVVSGVGREMDVLDEAGDRPRERTILGVNLGRPIGTLWRSYSHREGWGYAALPKLLRDFLSAFRALDMYVFMYGTDLCGDVSVLLSISVHVVGVDVVAADDAI